MAILVQSGLNRVSIFSSTIFTSTMDFEGPICAITVFPKLGYHYGLLGII